jgi:hypothetical protein
VRIVIGELLAGILEEDNHHYELPWAVALLGSWFCKVMVSKAGASFALLVKPVTPYCFLTAIAAIFFANIDASAFVSEALPLTVSSACVFSFAISRIRTFTEPSETR